MFPKLKNLNYAILPTVKRTQINYTHTCTHKHKPWPTQH